MYTLKVVEIIAETNDAITLCFKQPGLKKVHYLPGQYLTLVLRINGRRYIRPYSFSSAPSVNQFLEITIKRVPGGIVSNHIIDKVKIGDLIEVLPPMGKFVYKHEWLEKNTNVILWGVGSGITPLFSIAKYILANQTKNKVTLVYGNRSSESTIFYDKIADLKQQYSDRFNVWHFHTTLQISKDNPHLIQGRIQPNKVLSVMAAADNINNSLHYICGPAGLKESVKESLHGLNISKDKIFTEDFENVKDPKDFEDIYTQGVEINFDGIREVEVTKGRSILEAGLDALIDLPYSCQTGDCTLCKARIISGEVRMIGLEAIPEELADDECLLCCSYPVSAGVKLKLG